MALGDEPTLKVLLSSTYNWKCPVYIRIFINLSNVVGYSSLNIKL